MKNLSFPAAAFDSNVCYHKILCSGEQSKGSQELIISCLFVLFCLSNAFPSHSKLKSDQSVEKCIHWRAGLNLAEDAENALKERLKCYGLLHGSCHESFKTH